MVITGGSRTDFKSIQIMVRLITSYYIDKVRDRNQELIQCLVHNCNNKGIDEIILLTDVEVDCPVVSDKINIVNVGGRPTYQDAFNFASFDKECINIVCNADIYIDERNLFLIIVSLRENEIYALSRWDVDDINSGTGRLHNCESSQDTWIFKGEVKEGMYNIPIGIPGCDNRILHELESAGYVISNPSKNIKSFHLHKTNIHNYDVSKKSIIEKPYLFVKPTYIVDKAEFIDKEIIDTTRAYVIDDDGLLTYDFDAQKQVMDELLKTKSFNKTHLLTIAIPTMYERKECFSKLKAEFERQIKEYELYSYVEIKSNIDGGFAPIGWKQNWITMNCGGGHIVCWDDDDFPAPDALKKIIDTLKENPNVDCITFNSLMIVDGEREELMKHHVSYKTNKPMRHDGDKWRERMPSHTNVIKREIRLAHPFIIIKRAGAKNRKERNDSGSDVTFSKSLVESRAIQTSVHIDEVLYYYNFKTDK